MIEHAFILHFNAAARAYENEFLYNFSYTSVEFFWHRYHSALFLWTFPIQLGYNTIFAKQAIAGATLPWPRLNNELAKTTFKQLNCVGHWCVLKNSC
jgi:hypothetical protein